MKPYTTIKEYEQYYLLPEFDLPQMAMMGDVRAHAQLDANVTRESVIATSAKIKIVRLDTEAVERERREIEMSGVLYSPPS